MRISVWLDKKTAGEPREAGPFCYLSPLPQNELHPYGEPKVLVSDATDPIMRFMRAYYKTPYLVLGHVYWSNDVPRLASITRPYFQQIARWIRREWRKPDGWDSYCGPEAQSLLESGAQPVNFLPEAQ